MLLLGAIGGGHSPRAALCTHGMVGAWPCGALAHPTLCFPELQDIVHISRSRKPAFILSSMRDEKRT